MNGTKLTNWIALDYQICIKCFQKTFSTFYFDYIKLFLCTM